MSKVSRTKYVSHIAIYFGVVYTLKWKTTTSWKYLRDDRYHRENNYGSVTKLVFMSDGHFDTLSLIKIVWILAGDYTLILR